MFDAQMLYRCMCLMSGMFPRLLYTEKIDAIFVWGRAVDEWQSTRFDDGILQVAADLHRLTGAFVSIPGYIGAHWDQGGTGYPGPTVWSCALETLGVPTAYIFPLDGRGHNTKSEMDDFLDLACECHWPMVMAVTQQPHALRAMLGTVKSLTDRGLLNKITVVPVWPALFDWNRKCYGSQGVGPYPRSCWIDEEFERIPRYQAKGDLATLDELHKYLMRIQQP